MLIDCGTMDHYDVDFGTDNGCSDADHIKWYKNMLVAAPRPPLRTEADIRNAALDDVADILERLSITLDYTDQYKQFYYDAAKEAPSKPNKQTLLEKLFILTLRRFFPVRKSHAYRCGIPQSTQ